jgi:cytochrome c-type biogenesis protein CcmH
VGTLRAAVIFAFVALFTPMMTLATLAVQPDEILTDKTQEQRARSISAGLRCLVCQNQSIDDSDAPLARDLRLIVRERIKAGDNDSAVVDYVVARYGEYVLLKPPMKTSTLVLWLSPFFLLIVGVWLGRKVMRSSGALERAPPLSEAEQKRLAEILGSSPKGDGR